jgi:hypothetical protein
MHNLLLLNSCNFSFLFNVCAFTFRSWLETLDAWS